jgi:hypothetical protein
MCHWSELFFSPRRSVHILLAFHGLAALTCGPRQWKMYVHTVHGWRQQDVESLLIVIHQL